MPPLRRTDLPVPYSAVSQSCPPSVTGLGQLPGCRGSKVGINTLGAWRSEAEIALHEPGGHLQRGRAVCTGARPREGSTEGRLGRSWCAQRCCGGCSALTCGQPGQAPGSGEEEEAGLHWVNASHFLNFFNPPENCPLESEMNPLGLFSVEA